MHKYILPEIIRPLVTVDIAIFTVKNQQLQVLLVKRPDKKDEPVVDGFGDFGGFGGFGDMSGFGGFGVAETTEKVVDAVVEDAIPESDNATFGGLNTSEPSTKSDVAETPITPEGWGSDAGFNFGTGFDDIFKTENVKFGQ